MLKNSKAAEFIIPMKNDLILLDEMFSMYSREFVELREVNQIANAAMSSIDNNRNVSNKDLSKLKDISYKKIYDSFYDNADACLRSLTTALEKKSSFTGGAEGDEMEDKKSLNSEQAAFAAIGMEDNFEEARNAYNAAIEDYKIFIAQ
jgi:hypothetical protein